MAKTKTRSRNNSKDLLRGTNGSVIRPGPVKSAEDLISEASEALERSQPDDALPLVRKAVEQLHNTQQQRSVDDLLRLAAQEKATLPSALLLLGDVYLALGSTDEARQSFEEAIKLDADGALVSAEPWLQLAQLSESGGRESVAHFEKAIEVMKNEIEILEEESSVDHEETRQILDYKRSRVADALCGMTEVYMTDLSWEPDAEARCEQLVTEAVAICPEQLSAGPLQTLASVRISQERIDEAKRALAGSISIWQDLPVDVENPAKPDFATRVSLVRLLMEVSAEEEAKGVLENLVKEDDQSVETWYLGGWCEVLLSQKENVSAENKSKHVEQARTWLGNCLKLYQSVGYEDERLKDHATELVQQLNKALGIGDDEEWEDTDEDDQEGDDEIETDDDERDNDVEMT